MTRCLLLKSEVTKTLWADALHTAFHIRIKCSSIVIEGKIPEAMWTGKEVKLDHL